MSSLYARESAQNESQLNFGVLTRRGHRRCTNAAVKCTGLRLRHSRRQLTIKYYPKFQRFRKRHVAVRRGRSILGNRRIRCKSLPIGPSIAGQGAGENPIDGMVTTGVPLAT
jgi:hypothetical protein